MILENGYELTTTFWDDFTIADKFGIAAIKDTFARAFTEWRENGVYLTELVVVLNHKIWQWYEKDKVIADVYNNLWMEADAYACDHLKGEDLKFFYRVTD